MYAAALVATLAGVIVLTVLTVLRRFEDKTDDRVRMQLALSTVDDVVSLKTAKESLKTLEVVLSGEHYERDVLARRREYHAVISVPRALDVEHLMEAMERVEGVLKVRIS